MSCSTTTESIEPVDAYYNINWIVGAIKRIDETEAITDVLDLDAEMRAGSQLFVCWPLAALARKFYPTGDINTAVAAGTPSFESDEML